MRPPSNPRTVRRSLSRCGKCGEMMALVSTPTASSSSNNNNNNDNKHFLRCSSSMCTNASGQASFFSLPRKGTKFKGNQHICPLCNYQVVDVETSTSKRPYQICPQCFNFPPPDIMSDIENVPSKMPCFKCPAASRCTLATGNNEETQEVARCPTCLTHPLMLRSSSAKSGQNRVVKTFRLSCTNCQHVVWLPRIIKNVAVTNKACTKCSGAQRKTFMLKIEFKRGEHPPNIDREITICVVAADCSRILSNLGYNIKRGKIPSSSFLGSNGVSYGVMTGIRSSQNMTSSSLSSSFASSSSSSKRPSILRPQKKKRARTSEPRTYGTSEQSSNNVPKCICGKPCVEYTVKKQTANQGRKFYKCKNANNNGCNFFKFADEC